MAYVCRLVCVMVCADVKSLEVSRYVPMPGIRLSKAHGATR